MSADPVDAPLRALDAGRAAALLAVDPAGLGGAVLRAPAGGARDAWIASFRAGMPAGSVFRRLPLNISDDRLLGGLDLVATLQCGRRVAQMGVLAGADGGVIAIPMAERLAPGLALQIAGVIDTGMVVTEREGLSLRAAARFVTLACDEGIDGEERVSAALRDRLAFHLELGSAHDLGETDWTREDIAAARGTLAQVVIGDDAIEALCATALALGIGSARAVLMTVAVARASAALAGHGAVGEDDLALAGRLVLAPRATRLPQPAEPDASEPEQSDAESEPENTPDQPLPEMEADDDSRTQESDRLEDLLLEAVAAALPEGLLASLDCAARVRSGGGAAGRSGAKRTASKRGRPLGARAGDPGAGVRLDIIATLRQAAPWQGLRRAGREQRGGEGAHPLIEIRRDDFRIRRFAERVSQTTVFAVDASGSAALQRLGEAKGAVELMLADCYIRRDRVALIAFRGTQAELLLAPTRSLTRARRALGSLPGGGGTPLAAGIDLARETADLIARQDETALVVMLTDGGANIARDGQPGRPQAETDARAAAQRFKARGLRSLLIDTSLRPRPLARQIADAMGSVYMPLPNADAASISMAARALDQRGPRPSSGASGR